MKKLNKIFLIMMFIVIIINVIAGQTFAMGVGDLEGTKATGFNSIGNAAATVIKTIGMVVSIVMVIVLGLKYMLGSAEEKATYKKSMIPYLIGAVCLFASSALVGVVYEVTKNLAN